MLTATIIAKDAGQTLAATIKNVRRVADEIVVVVDDRTQDETELVAKSLGARVFRRKFKDFADQKNFALNQARGEWIFSLDADESISDELLLEIKRVTAKTECAGYYIPRLNYIWGKVITHTNWEPEADCHIWLFRKAAGRWVGKVHEEVMVTGQVGRLKGFKLHQNYQTVEQFVTKMNDYTSRETGAANPVVEFGRRYIWHLGFLDGWHGLFLSYLQAISRVVVWVKLWEKKKFS